MPLGTDTTDPLGSALDRLLVASVRDHAIFALTPDGRVATWNPGAMHLKGYAASEIIGRHVAIFHPPEGRARDGGTPRAIGLLERAARDGRAEDEGWRVRKDGTRFWANVVITAMRDEAGEFVGFAKVTRDLTERHRAEAAARELAAAEAARVAAEREGAELALLAQRLEEQSFELESQSEEAQALAEELEQTNEQLQQTALEAETARDAAETALARITRLQEVAAALSHAIDLDGVTRTATREVRLALGADAAYVVRTTPDPGVLEFVSGEGFPVPIGERIPFSREARVPGAEVVRTGRPLWFDGPGASRRHFGADDASPISRLFGASATLPLVTDGRPSGAIGIHFTHARSFAAEDRAFLGALAEQVAVALERARLFEAEQQARAAATAAQRRAEFLSEASRLLTSSLDYHATLQGLARAAVPRLADWCTVDMIADPGSGQWPPRVERLAVMHQDPAKIEWAKELERRRPTNWEAPTGLPRVLHHGVTEFVPSITDDLLVGVARDEEELAMLREIGFRAYLCVPLRVRGVVVGALTLVMTESGRHYDEADHAMAEELGHRASLAIEHAELYREAQQANAAKTQFLAVMSHELRTPLNAIGGYADLLELGVRGPVNEAQRTDLQRIRRGQQHLLTLINEVLDFARIEAGQAQYRIEDVRLAEVVETVTTLIAPQAGAKRLALSAQQLPDGFTARADREKVQQILVNLLSNAVKFTAEGGRVALHATMRGSVVEIAVSDTGIGIPSDRQGSIFEPFVQVQSALTRTVSGTGLGLAISRDLARGMGGDLRVESTVGAGSTFTLMLPRPGITV